MFTLRCIIFLCTITVYFNSYGEAISNSLDTLKLVQVLHRHGDRNRISEYPLDPHKNAQIGPKGKGQLTDTGKSQAIEVGKYLRGRYNGFIKSTYSVDQVVAKSSHRMRTIQTAKGVLEGLFPHQHIPVHTIPSKNDNILLQKASCPKYSSLYKAEKRSSIVKDFDKQHAPFYQYLSHHSGKHIKSAVEAQEIIDVLIVEKAHGLKLPDWTHKSDFWKTAEEIGMSSFARKNGHRLQSKRLYAGPLVTNFVHNMETKRKQIEHPSPNQKHLANLLEFSGHDSTIFSFLKALEIPIVRMPPYAAAVLIELHKSHTHKPGKDSYFVRIFYKDSDKAAEKLDIPKCREPCSLHHFKTLYSYLLINHDQWIKECHQ